MIGEASFTTISGDQIDLLFSTRALAEAETLMGGKGIVGMLQGFASGGSTGIGINDLACMLAAGMEAYRRYNKTGGKRINKTDAFDVMDNSDFSTVAEAVFGAIGESLAPVGEPGDETEKN